MRSHPADQRILEPRRLLQGAGSPDALENVLVDQLPQRSVCYVDDQDDWYVLDKFDTSPVSPPNSIATGRGSSRPGRWHRYLAQGATADFAPNVAYLRAHPSLIPNGSCYLICHTVPGYGSGHVWWDGSSTDPDDGGSTYAVTGVPVGRWKRNAEDIICDSFGAVGNWDPIAVTGVDSTAALRAYNAWLLANPATRAGKLGLGTYLYQSPLPLVVATGYELTGEGIETSRIWRKAPDNYTGTSTTSLAIDLTPKAIVTQSGLAYANGVRVRATSNSNPDIYFEGPVTSYGGTALALTPDTIEGSGTHSDWTIRFAGNLFEFSTSSVGPFVWGCTIDSFTIDGDAHCGSNALHVWSKLLRPRINLEVTGGFEHALYAYSDNAPNPEDRCGIQWTDKGNPITLTSTRSGPNGPTPRPRNYVRINSYANDVDLEIKAIGNGVEYGTTFDMRANYVGGSNNCNVSISGDGQRRLFYIKECQGVTLHDVLGEGVLATSIIEDCQQFTALEAVFAQVQLINSPRVSVTKSLIYISKDLASCVGFCDDGGTSIGNSRSLGIVSDGVPPYTVGGFGRLEPENIARNGDFARMRDATHASGSAGNSIQTQSLTRTASTSYSLLLAQDPGQDPIGGTITTFCMDVTGPLPVEMVGSPVVIGFKAKVATGATPIYLDLTDRNQLGTYAGIWGGQIASNDGYAIYSYQTVVTADMVTYGIRSAISFEYRSTIDVKDLQVVLGTQLRRMWTRCAHPFGLLETLDVSGEVITQVTSVPVSANDPVYGEPWKDGDVARLHNPVEQVASGGQHYITTGWVRSAGAWKPQQYLTGLAP